MNFHKSGIFIINKPYKWTSNDVLRKIKSRYKFRKIGHAGTLDPLATGILPLLINDTTKYFNYFQTFTKSYIAEIRFGYSTSTFDLEGEILNETNKIPKDLDLIAKKLSSFLGEIEQVPPKYSAIKKNGKRLYEYARKNQRVKIDSRKVKVNSIKAISWESPILTISINCSSGFYIRSLVNDLAESLDSLATLINLSRINYGPFQIKNSIDLKDFEEIENKLLSTDLIFSDNKKLLFDIQMENNYYNGKVFNSENLNINSLNYDDIKIYNYSRKFIGLLSFDHSKKFWKPKNIIR